MISDRLTSELMATGEVKIVGAENLKDRVAEAGFANLDIAQLFDSNGIGMIITGRYYIQDDQLYVQANIIDTKTGQVAHAPSPIIGSSSPAIAASLRCFWRRWWIMPHR